VFSDERVLGEGFKLFYRYLFGVFSIWDIFLVFAIFIAFLKNKRPCSRLDSNLMVVGIIWVIALLLGMVHATIFQYGPTGFRNIATQLAPIFYFAASIYLSLRFIQTEDDVIKIYNVLQWCSIIITIEGMFFLLLSAGVELPILRGYGGIPIVVYDGLAFLNITLLIVVDKYLRGLKLSRLDKILLISGILFTLLSTRRMNLALLVINVVVLYLINGRSIFSARAILNSFKYMFKYIFPAVAILYLLSPSLLETFIFVIETFNMGSAAGEISAGYFRLIQIENLFLNLTNQGLLSYIFGMGLGTMWFEFVPLPDLNPDGDAGYIASAHDLGSIGWWPYFHLANIAMIYRYGFAGTIMIATFSFNWLYKIIKSARAQRGLLRSIAVVAALISFETIIVLGDSTDASWPALCGILVGISIILARRFRLSMVQSEHSDIVRLTK